MSFENKYRVHEVAKDFKKQTKDITQILTKYATAPKNHMQVLNDRELSIIFEYLTQNNQVADLESVFANAKPAAPKGEESKASAAPAKGREKGRDQKKDRPAGNKPAEQAKPAQGKEKPQQAQQPKADAPKADAAKQSNTRVPAKKLVDTRKAGNVNLDKYDERLENMAPERANKMQGGKQKVQSGKQRRGGNFGNKRKQEEQEKMRRLQLRSPRRPPSP